MIYTPAIWWLNAINYVEIIVYIAVDDGPPPFVVHVHFVATNTKNYAAHVYFNYENM